MLASLRAIVQEVNSARSLPEVLSIIVKELKSSLAAGVCSVYLFDPRDQRYVLMATEGHGDGDDHQGQTSTAPKVLNGRIRGNLQKQKLGKS